MKFGAYAANDALSIKELSGNVGIGTTTPGFPLTFPDIFGDKISLYGQSGDHYGFGIQSGVLQIHAAGSNDDIVFGFGGSGNFKERVRFEGNGEVGLGTTIPDRNLDIYHSNSGGGIEIDRSLTTIWSGIVYENNGAENWFIGVQANSDDLLFKDNAAGISMVIEDGTGNVGIGTTDPAYKLDVEGTVQAHAYDTGDIFFRKDGQRLWRMFEDEAGLYLENLRTSKVYTFVLHPIQEENETERVVDFGVVIDELKAENQALKHRLDALEKMMRQQQFANGKEI
jgi:hypothetical protein